MSKSTSRKKKAPKRVLALPDLEHAKTAVLNSLTSALRDTRGESSSDTQLVLRPTGAKDLE